MSKYFQVNRKPFNRMDWLISWLRGFCEIIDGVVRILTLGRISAGLNYNLLIKQLRYMYHGPADEDQES